MYKLESVEKARKAAYYQANREKIMARNRAYAKQYRAKSKATVKVEDNCLCGKKAYRMKQNSWVCERCDKCESIDWVNGRNGTGYDVHYYTIVMGTKRFA